MLGIVAAPSCGQLHIRECGVLVVFHFSKVFQSREPMKANQLHALFCTDNNTKTMRTKLFFLCILTVAVCACRNRELESRVEQLEKVAMVSISEQIESIKSSISTLEGVNRNLSSYIETNKGDINNLKSSNDKLGKDIDQLKKLIEDNSKDLKTWVENSYATLEMYQTLSKDINDIKTTLESLSGRVDSVETQLKTLISSIEQCSKEIEDIKDGLTEISKDIDALKKKLSEIVNSIQSIVVLPDYSDGSVRMTGMAENEIKFEVYPLEVAKQIAEMGTSAFSLDYITTETKAKEDFTAIRIDDVSFNGKVLIIVADGSVLPDSILAGEQAVNARLKVSTGIVTKTSEFFAFSFDSAHCITLEAKILSPTSVSLTGYSARTGKNVSLGFEYALSQESIASGSISATITGDSHFFSAELTGLTPEETYYYRAFSEVGNTRYYGDIASFETSNYEYVDLGLSVKWATCNLGARSPYEDGDYYAFGELTTKDSFTIDNYNPLSNYAELPENADVAALSMGGKWRMPSQSEMHELIENCSFTFVEKIDGKAVPGYIVKSKMNGNQIFIPSSGKKDESGLSFYHQLASVRSLNSLHALRIIDNSATDIWGRFYPQVSDYEGIPIRPVLGDRKPPVESISLEPVSLSVGAKLKVTASLYPENCSVDCLIWYIGDENIAFLNRTNNDYYAVIVGKSVGTTTLTAYCGDQMAKCEITVTDGEYSTEMIDLGLSVKWATCNLGASNPEDAGFCCVWGGLEHSFFIPTEDGSVGYIGPPTDYTKWMDPLSENQPKLHGYNYNPAWGTVDNLGVLRPEDDIATVTLGSEWRLPTKKEWLELLENTIVRYSYDYNGTGVPGVVFDSKIKGYEDKSLFIPYTTYHNPLWTSTVTEDCQYSFAYYIEPISDYWSQVMRSLRIFEGYVRPVFGERKPYVTGINLSKTEVSLREWTELEDFKITIQPEGAACDELALKIQDESVIYRRKDGLEDLLVAGREGKTTISFTSVDGGYTASLDVTVSPAEYSYEYVDLGTGVKWATCNLGAISPEEPGMFFAWGETEPKSSYTFDNYKWFDSNRVLTKYDYPYAKLEPEDDAATVRLGGKWRIPTHSDWSRLRGNCDWEKVSDYNGTGVGGWLVTSIKNNNSIFIPYTGVCQGSVLLDRNTRTILWSNETYGDSKYVDYGRCIELINSSDGPKPKGWNKPLGYPIRPVLDDTAE